MLDLNRTQVSDAGLLHLRNLTNLEWLMLIEARVSDAGLENIKSLTNLKMLYLDRTSVTNAGMSSLAGMANMEILTLNGTSITDAGLQQLKDLRRLKQIYLNETFVTLDGVKRFKAKLPSLTIIQFSETRALGIPVLMECDAKLSFDGNLDVVALSIDRKQFDDKAVATLHGLERIRKLALDRTSITGARALIFWAGSANSDY